MSVITRFAPSPSGSLHLGGARTALFNYIYAKSQKGIFKIRIEDTDENRKSNEAVKSIIDGLHWLGIKEDTDLIFQKNNITRHISVANHLLNKELAYKCFLNEEEVEQIKIEKKKIRSIWREKKEIQHPQNRSFVVRMKIPEDKNIVINDLIQGKIVVKSNEIDDYIILRSNGNPTFLLSSAVDDFDMNISHIIRGDDHLTNTFRQYFIFRELYKKLPEFAHIPLIHNENGKKLSKRDNVKSILDLKGEGFINKAILNYLLRLGWSYKNHEIISLDQAIELFKINNIGKSPARIDNKKISFLNSHYLKNLNKDEILDVLFSKIEYEKYKLKQNNKEVINELIEIFIKRSKTINQLFDSIKFIFRENYKITNSEEKDILNNSKEYKLEIIKMLKSIDTWELKIIEESLKTFVDNKNINFKYIGQPLRIILTQSLNSPSIAKIIKVLGKKEVIKKLDELW